MKKRIMANLAFSTPARRDSFKEALAAKAKGMSFYDRNESYLEDMEGKPTCSVDMRSDEAQDAATIYLHIKDRMEKIPVFTGRISIHACHHDEPPENWKPCVVEEEFNKQ